MLTDIHASEVAFWPDAESLMTGMLGALTQDGEIWLESTANGMGGYFWELYQQLVKQLDAGIEPSYQLHFFPWTVAQEYRRPIKEGTLWTSEELYLRQKYNLDLE